MSPPPIPEPSRRHSRGRRRAGGSWMYCCGCSRGVPCGSASAVGSANQISVAFSSRRETGFPETSQDSSQDWGLKLSISASPPSGDFFKSESSMTRGHAPLADPLARLRERSSRRRASPRAALGRSRHTSERVARGSHAPQASARPVDARRLGCLDRIRHALLVFRFRARRRSTPVAHARAR